jgi:AMP nucleosidase
MRNSLLASGFFTTVGVHRNDLEIFGGKALNTSNKYAMNEEKDIKRDELDPKEVSKIQTPIKTGLKTKEAIVMNWLPRYTGRPLNDFGEYIILTNFSRYLQLFSEWNENAPIVGLDKPMQSVSAAGITIINFGMGSSVAATVMDLLTAIKPKAVIFLGKCGGLKKKNNVGDLILPIAAIRGEGTSNDYLPAEVPALPAFALQKAISTTIRDFGRD